MNRKMLFISFLFLAGCGGHQHITIHRCVPAVEYVSTEEHEFIAYQLINQSLWQSFDPLRLAEKGHYSLKVIRHGETSIEQYGESNFKIIRFNNGTRLRLTGNAIERRPWGIDKSFSSRMTYLEGEIDTITVWAPTFYFRDFYKSNSEQNRKNSDVINFESLYDWDCPEK
ncbi:MULTISPECIES: hypothetical protein [Deefgea]|uniref:Lipoprotein n=1 Tax=Deefgea chitinilytica TaxID=570276 RepID=A0ABS2CFU0_9NEIS|nr:MULTISPECIES: hypothetical protein [Deefgea]MBM5573024.1 hypothetical protein [Deefgea chitinilytica]MBM9890260.1 hypothetical protein [Deefgea sp. CFH1-16]